ncbi:LysM peptidoglycan-binding domain-containing protein [Photobacterium sp. J15]|uniref:LysM peptidoglycan-binding domain-containing protein n=1 Tax=Photobacterium sp. J15 TaxID=265901 RepID=UPI0007E3666D|nr:LysM peptidoglycan-binding domain-containing protein [Photobacterium sp. J15]
MRQLVLYIALLFVPFSWAEPSRPVIKKDIPSVYTVVKGDTLWDISEHFLENPWLWPKLWEANSYIKNPHLIYPGDRLHLVWVDGQPRLRVKKSVKLSPSIRVKRSPITTLPESLMLPYLAEHKLLAPGKLERLPRVLGNSSNKGYMSPGDSVWIDTALDLKEEWWVYRPDAEFNRLQQTDEGKPKVRRQAVALKEIARVTVTAHQDGISRVTVNKLREEVRQNDVLLPAPLPGAELDLSFVPSPPPQKIAAKVLGQLEGHHYIATSEVVVIDRGLLDRLVAGNVLQLYRSGAVVKGVKGDYHYKDASLRFGHYQLSDVPIGEVMVIRPYEHFSLAVVTRASEPFRAGVLALPPKTVSL